MVAEQTMGSKVCGYRVVFASADMSMLAAMNQAREKPSPVIEYPVHMICLGVKTSFFCCPAIREFEFDFEIELDVECTRSTDT